MCWPSVSATASNKDTLSFQRGYIPLLKVRSRVASMKNVVDSLISVSIFGICDEDSVVALDKVCIHSLLTGAFA